MLNEFFCCFRPYNPTFVVGDTSEGSLLHRLKFTVFKLTAGGEDDCFEKKLTELFSLIQTHADFKKLPLLLKGGLGFVMLELKLMNKFLNRRL
jgi:hypothetical protein